MLPGGRFYLSQLALNHQNQESLDHHPAATRPLHILHAQRFPFLLQKHLRPLHPHGLRWTHGRCLVRQRAVYYQAVGQTAEAREGTGDQYDVDVQRRGRAPLQSSLPHLLAHHILEVLGLLIGRLQ